MQPFIHINRLGLLKQLVRRDVMERYQGSLLGVFWSFVTPLLLLLVYSFVFTFVFDARFGLETGKKGEFAVILFVGVIIHTLMGECLARSPSLITSQPNLVKKVVFPLVILTPVLVGSALFHLLISSAVLGIGILFVYGSIPWTAIFFPIVLLPYITLIFGISWFVSSIGVYLRDIQQTIGIVITLLLFLSPVFYPLSQVPKDFQIYFYLNPITWVVEQSRMILIGGQSPDWLGFGIYCCIAILGCRFGYYWFRKTERGFADVL